MIGPMDPMNQHKFTLYAPDASTAVTVRVYLDLNNKTCNFCEQAGTGYYWKGSWLDVVVCRFSPADPAIVAQVSRSDAEMGWVQNLADRSKHLGARAVKVYRKHIDKVQPVAQVVGSVAGLLGVPHASAVVATASGLANLNKAIGSGEQLHKWCHGRQGRR